MTIEDIDYYLNDSRDDIKRAVGKISGIKVCCPGVYGMLDSLEDTQKFLDDAVWQYRNSSSGLGQAQFLPYIIVGGLSFLSWIGSKVYDHFTTAKQYNQYLDCIKTHEDAGTPPEQAAYICKGGTDSGTGSQAGATDQIMGMLKLAIGAGISLMVLYLLFQFMKK